MAEPLLQIWNKHSTACGQPPAITNTDDRRYYGYFENRFGEQLFFVYDPDTKTAELRGGDIQWDKVATVQDGKVDLVLGKAEAAWLRACWLAATAAG